MTSRLSLRSLIAAGFVPLVAASLALSGCSDSTDDAAPSFKGKGSGMTTVNNSDREEENAEETTAAQKTVTKEEEAPEEPPVVTVTQTEKQEAPSSTGGGQKTGVETTLLVSTSTDGSMVATPTVSALSVPCSLGLVPTAGLSFARPEVATRSIARRCLMASSRRATLPKTAITTTSMRIRRS